jgi:DNA-binding beta-propeller fold protein YncE
MFSVFGLLGRRVVAVVLALAVGQVWAGAARAEDATTQAAPSSGYAVIKKVKLGGEGGWDLLTIDPDAGRLYLSRATHVMVVDTKTLAVVGDIDGGDGVHGIALAPQLHRGFITNGKAGTVTVFDTQTLAKIATLQAGKKPDAIMYEPTTKKVLCFNGKSEDVTAFDADFDAAKPAAGTTLALGGAPELGVADGTGKVFVNLEDKSEVVQFDAAAMKVLNHWALAPGEAPTGIAMDRATRRLFIGCANQLMTIVDADSGKVIKTVPIDSRVDGAAFDDEAKVAFTSNGQGTLSVVKENGPNDFVALAAVTTQPGAKTLALDPKTHLIYLPTADFPADAGTEKKPKPLPGTFMILVVGPAK